MNSIQSAIHMNLNMQFRQKLKSKRLEKSQTGIYPGTNHLWLHPDPTPNGCEISFRYIGFKLQC